MAESAPTPYVPLRVETHSDMAVLPARGYAHAACQTLIPIVAAELAQAARHFALGFAPQESAPRLVAVVGVEPGRNLYVLPDHRWVADYVPALLKGRPFALAKADESRRVLCVDASSEWLVPRETAGSEPLYTEAGESAEVLQRHLRFLQQRDDSRAATDRAVGHLADLGLLMPWAPRVPLGDDRYRQLEGLLKVDEGALNRLNADTLKALQQSGALALAYTQLLAVHNIDRLAKRYRLQQRLAERQAQSSAAPEALDSLFDGDDDDLTFDFDR